MRDIFDITDENYDVSSSEALNFQKVAFSINSAISTLMGYATGRELGKTIGEEKAKTDMTRNMELPTIEGDYYSQVKNIAKNLKVLFSPMSVIYILNDKGREITLDVIETDEMDSIMREAFSNKDKNYFKNLFVYESPNVYLC